MSEAPWSRRQVLGAMAAGAGCALVPAAICADNPRGILIRDVRLVDGSGAPARGVDVLLRGGTVESVGRISSRTAKVMRIVNGDGRVLAPGFIDAHAHGDPLQQSFESYLAMGVTTIVLGQDGGSPRLLDGADVDVLSDEAGAGVSAWLDAAEHGALDVNVATLTGHGALRRQARIDDGTRRPSPLEVARMQALLEADLRAGSYGLSTGLEYVPGRYAQAEELTALGAVVARYDGIAMSHMRSEDEGRIRNSIEELIAFSRPARPHISHLKVIYGKGEAEATALMEFIHDKRRSGVELTADAYPYVAGYTGVAILFPEWALPPTDYAHVVGSRRDELRGYLERRMMRRGGPEALLFGSEPYAGKTLARAASEAGKAFPDFLIEMGPTGGSGAHFTMDERLQRRLLLDPIVAISTDGAPGMHHPRSTGTYAKWIEEFVVGRSLLPLEEAVRKATGLPASIMRFPDRGTIRPGAKADLVLFDPSRVRARSDYVDPFALSEGFDMVLVNGVPAFEDGEQVAKSGDLLRRGRGSNAD